MKPKPLWVLSNWIKKKTIERLKKLLSPPHYYWYILPDKSFIICKVWLSYLTSINFLVILCLFTITHLLLCFFKYFSPNEFFSPFFPKNCLKSLPSNNKKFFTFLLLLVIFNYYSEINGRISTLCTTIITASRCINCW